MTSSPYIINGKTDAERYLEAIQRGDIVANVHMRRLADIMLPRFHEEYHGFHFDVKKSLRAVQFVERFTCYPEGEKMGQPFILDQWQRAVMEMAFGFVDDDGYRQFRQVILEVARKNGKSSWMAALALYFLTSDNEPGAEVLCIANSEQQSRRVFGHADTMRRRSPTLKNRIRRGMSQKRGVSGLNYDKNDSILVSIPANVGTADGYSASAYIYDELAACTDMGAMLSAIEESISGRRQATGWIISSENHVRHNVWDEKIDYCRGILAGKIEDDTILPILYCLDQGDSFLDSSVYLKANPGLTSGVKSMRYMEDRAKAAVNSPQVKTSFMTKDLCLRVNSYTSFLSENECVNHETFTPNPTTDRYCCVGFDLSDRGDLTAAVAAFMRPGDDRIYEYSHAWIPETQIEINSARDLKQRDGVPYNVWASGDNPWLTIVQGDKVDHHVAILGFIDELAEMGLYTRYVGYDPWHVDDYLLRELHMRVGSDNCVAVKQNTKVLSPLMKEHKIDLAAHRIVNPSPVLAWNRSSVQSKIDAAGNVYPNKKELKPQNKIDMYMAELFAYKMLMVDHRDEYLQIIGWYPPEQAKEKGPTAVATVAPF